MTNTVFGRLQYYGTAAEKAAFTPLFTWTQWLETDTNTIYAWNGAAWITMAASGGSVGGSGTPGRIAEWTAATTLGDSTLAKTGAGLLTLTAAAPASLAVTGASSIAGSMTGGGTIATGGFTLTVPATGTAALMSYANAGYFMVDGNLKLPATTVSTAGVIEQAGGRFIHSYGANNLFFGAGSGNFTLSSGSMVGIGADTLQSITSGNTLVAIGFRAFTSATQANTGIAIGYASAYYLTTGVRDVFVGPSCGYHADGASSDNTAVGEGIMVVAGVKNRDTIVGSSGGRLLTTGSDNVLIGYRAGYSLTTESHKLYIENSASANPLIYGEFDNDLVEFNADSAKTNTIHDLLRLDHNTTGLSSAAGFGSRILGRLESDTTADQSAIEINWSWATATHASRAADLYLSAYYTTTAQEGIRIRGASGGVQVGLFGVTPISRAAAYTQTYSTAARTINPASTAAFTGIDNAQAGSVYAQYSELEQLRGDVLQLAQIINSLIDDSQGIGTAQ